MLAAAPIAAETQTPQRCVPMRHKREMVILSTLAFAALRPAADRTMLDWLRISLERLGWWRECNLFEAPLHTAVIRRVVAHAECMAQAIAREHRKVLRLALLDSGDVLGVGGELEHCSRPHRSSKLGVGDFVRPPAEVTSPVDPFEEVCLTLPATIEKRGLVDEVGGVAHRSLGGSREGGEVCASLLGSTDRDDPLTCFGRKPKELPLFMLSSAATQHVDNGIGTLRPRELTARGQALQPGQMRARHRAC
jgi:hypothetical protein